METSALPETQQNGAENGGSSFLQAIPATQQNGAQNVGSSFLQGIPATQQNGAEDVSSSFLHAIDTQLQTEQADGQQQPLAASTSTQPSQLEGISADEIALYDRQIRLWGVDSQQKLRNARVLLIGLKGLANEVAKNLVLAGINTLTIVDDGDVIEENLGAQFFLKQEDVGMNRAIAALPRIKKLNPRVKVQTTTLAILFADAAIFGAFSLVIATDMPLSELSTINAACRVQRVPFYASCTFGMYGFIFADLLQHDFVIEREQSNIITRLGPESGTRSIIGTAVLRQPDGKVMERVTKREIYTPILLANTSSLPGYNLSTWKRKMAVSPLLSCIRALWEYQSQTKLPKPSRSATDLTLFTTLATDKHKELQLPPETLRSEVLRSFMQNLGSEISPVCAFLGGQLAQDAINVIGGKGQPIQNMLIFDGDEFTGHVYALHSHVSAAIPREPTTGRPVVPPRFVGIPNGTALSRALMESNPAVQANMTAKGDSWDDVIAQGGQSSL